jgi:enoyl-CoA hydratase
MTTQLVTYDLTDGIATITMDDGKRNALSPAMFAAVDAAFARAREDRAVVVLAGRDGVFSAGFDLGVLVAGGPNASGMIRTGFELAERLLGFPAPIVVACTGHAIAMGVFLVLSGDYRVGALGDYKIGAIEVALGLTMPHFALEICRQRLAPTHLHRATVLSEMYRPEDAVAAGYLDRAVPAPEVRDEARRIALQLRKLDADTHAATKLRARGPTLQAIRAAIDADAAWLDA